MKRFLPLGLLVLALPLPAAEPAPAIASAELAAPAAAAAATGAAVTRGPDGTLWLSWIERVGELNRINVATLGATDRGWSAPRPVAHGTNLLINQADFPCLAAGPDGTATAVWSVNHPAAPARDTGHGQHGAGYHAVYSQTRDGGVTWSRPAPLTTESDAVEFVSVATLADGRVLAAWLDGRAKKAGGSRQQLYARILGAAEPDVLVDASVCDCCQTALTAFPDGTALLAYRGRGDDEIRDIRAARFRGARWDEPRPLNHDGWKISGCPVNGPQLASDGGRVAAAWFTAADEDPRVLATFSSDAGARFLLPLRLNDTKPLGRVATALLHDGALLVTFVDADGALWLRRVTPDFSAATAVKLAGPERGRVNGFPRVALRRDYEGGDAPAQLVVAFAQEGVTGVRTLLVTIPEGALLEAERNCDCAPTPEQLRGFPVRGTIVAAQPAGTLRVRHFEVPGIFAEGTREFRAGRELLERPELAGRQFLGRIEQRDGTWWLTEVRLIASPR